MDLEYACFAPLFDHGFGHVDACGVGGYCVREGEGSEVAGGGFMVGRHFWMGWVGYRCHGVSLDRSIYGE